MQITRLSLQWVDQVAVVSAVSFFGMLASNRDGFPTIVSDNLSGFCGNLDQRLFFFAAILFFWPVGSQHGCSILVWGSLGLQAEFDDKHCSGRVSWQRFP